MNNIEMKTKIETLKKKITSEQNKITATITDTTGVNTTIIEITTPENIKINLTTTKNGNQYSANFMNYTNGTYTYKIYTNDTLGNTDSSTAGTFQLYTNTTI